VAQTLAVTAFSSLYVRSQTVFSGVRQLNPKIPQSLTGGFLMSRTVKAVSGGRIHLIDNVLEIYEKKVTPYGNGAKIDSQKKHIGKRTCVIILKD